ncbi:MAG: helix-turn-helix transcriptional regulator [Lactobacillus sp.]|jgi:DNA-binding Xre family transcriptional regulator|nr:helix-turn-helix transcriptional regulator [Lactobacillus sp.]MCI1942470.1 helix-turn-helix transcriptional regulator [Lactobacillus sp.]MCI1973140.1 helix-turn-helix transcriptional regulator [Lactobacillus sp.]MCI2017808.1 helix-turn-helix transcriptional regulator [Lactobacillus sp.]MCI2038387.1 helix-turn-helix transcriptional regulator [Lactobacillus sp.]
MIVFKLREILDLKNISVNKLSKITGISRPTLTGMYYNESQMVQLRTLSKVSEALNVDVGDLMANDDKVRKISFPVTVVAGSLDANVDFLFQFRDLSENVQAVMKLEIVNDKYWILKIHRTSYMKRPDWVNSIVFGISKALCYQIIHTLIQEYAKRIYGNALAKLGDHFYNSLEYLVVIDECFEGAFSDNMLNDMYHYDDRTDTEGGEPLEWPAFEGSAVSNAREPFNYFDKNVVVQFRY